MQFVANTITDLTRGFIEFAEANPGIVDSAIAFLGVAATVSALTVVVYKLITGIQGLSTAFSTIAANPWALAIIAITAIVAGLTYAINEMVSGLGGLSSETRKLVAESKKLTDSIKEQKAAHEDNIQNIKLQIDTNKNLVNELNALSSVENKSADDKQRIKHIIDELNSAIPGLALAYDSETDSINKSAEAIQNAIEAEEARLNLSDKYAELNGIVEDRVKIEKELEEIQVKRSELETALAEQGDAWQNYEYRTM